MQATHQQNQIILTVSIRVKPLQLLGSTEQGFIHCDYGSLIWIEQIDSFANYIYAMLKHGWGF